MASYIQHFNLVFLKCALNLGREKNVENNDWLVYNILTLYYSVFTLKLEIKNIKKSAKLTLICQVRVEPSIEISTRVYIIFLSYKMLRRRYEFIRRNI